MSVSPQWWVVRGPVVRGRIDYIFIPCDPWETSSLSSSCCWLTGPTSPWAARQIFVTVGVKNPASRRPPARTAPRRRTPSGTCRLVSFTIFEPTTMLFCTAKHITLMQKGNGVVDSALACCAGGTGLIHCSRQKQNKCKNAKGFFLPLGIRW